jgi:succinyl-diaminopimelate desuccinylase
MKDFLRWIDPDDLRNLLQRLIRCASVNPPGDVRECASLIVQDLKRRGLPAETIEEKPGVANVISYLSGQSEGKTMIWNGHTDVVLPGEDWQLDPFSGEIGDGYIYGRGASDMKSGIAAMIIALDALKKAGSPFRGRIIFQAVGDEETGGDGGTLAIIRRKIGTEAAFAIVSEPTDLRVSIGNRGLRWFEVSLKGRASHAALPHLGANAIHAAARIIGGLERLQFAAHHPLFEVPHPSLSVTLIQGGTKVNIIPEGCTFSIDRRMMPGETPDSILQEIEHVIQSNTPAGIISHIRTTHSGWDPYAIDPDTHLVKGLGQAIQEVRGKFPQVMGKAPCTDASHLFHRAHIPTVCFGPGLDAMAHVANERVSLDKVVQAAQVFALSAYILLDGKDL